MRRRLGPALLAMAFVAACGGAGDAPAAGPAESESGAVAPANAAQVTVYKSPT